MAAAGAELHRLRDLQQPQRPHHRHRSRPQRCQWQYGLYRSHRRRRLEVDQRSRNALLGQLRSAHRHPAGLQPQRRNQHHPFALDPNDATDSFYGEGLLRSSDGGLTWTLIQNSQDGANGDHSFIGLATAGIAFSTATPTLVVAAFSTSPQSAHRQRGGQPLHSRPVLLHRRRTDLADGHDLRRCHLDAPHGAAQRQPHHRELCPVGSTGTGSSTAPSFVEL